MLLRLIRSLFAGKDAAAPASTAAADLRTDDADACERLAGAGQLEAALECYRARAAANPSDLAARVDIANTLASLWRMEESIGACAEALAAAPCNCDLFSSFLLYSHYAQAIEAQVLFQRHARYGDLLASTVSPTYRDRWQTPPEPHRRLRIGYVSRNFSRHSVGYFVEPVIEHHDRQQFEICCYYTHPLSDDVTARIAAQADLWRHLPDATSDELAAGVHEDRIDVLIDLGGHTKFSRLAAFAREPAPIQLTWLGYPDTTGVRSIAYRVTDTIADPPGAADALHTETLLRLAPPFVCYRPPEDAPRVTVRAEEGPVTFGSFNALVKVTDAMVAIWCRVLAAVPRSRIVIKTAVVQDEAAGDRLRERFAQHGIGADRVELRGWSDTRDVHLAAYGDIDIALDTFPYNGTTTTCEALWMGVPVVTLAGGVHMARVGATLLSCAGLPELVARTDGEYVQTAVALAADAPRRARLRAGMREQMLASPLLDHRGFARKLEAAYRETWQAWCRAHAGQLRS